MPIEIECPSGLVGKVRGLKGRDGRFLTDQTIARQGTMIDHILGACWEETVEPGVYSNGAIRPDGFPNWGKVLQGDRTYADPLHLQEDVPGIRECPGDDLEVAAEEDENAAYLLYELEKESAEQDEGGHWRNLQARDDTGRRARTPPRSPRDRPEPSI